MCASVLEWGRVGGRERGRKGGRDRVREGEGESQAAADGAPSADVPTTSTCRPSINNRFPYHRPYGDSEPYHRPFGDTEV